MPELLVCTRRSEICPLDTSSVDTVRTDGCISEDSTSAKHRLSEVIRDAPDKAQGTEGPGWGVGHFGTCHSNRRMRNDGTSPHGLPGQAPLHAPAPTPARSRPAALPHTRSSSHPVPPASPDGNGLFLPFRENEPLSPGLAMQRSFFFFFKKKKKGRHVPLVVLRRGRPWQGLRNRGVPCRAGSRTQGPGRKILGSVY